jgi:DNA-binding MarR family transcriptional regulator
MANGCQCNYYGCRIVCDSKMSIGTRSPDTSLTAAAVVPLRELSPQELGGWRGLLRVHSALVKALDAELIATHGLPLTSYEVLINLQAAPGRRRRMAELADSVLLSRSGTTRLVDRLERDGLLERDTCDSDGRGCFAVLTDRGEELLSKARATHLEGVRERFLNHFDAAELEQMAAWWNRVLPGAADVADLSRTD